MDNPIPLSPLSQRTPTLESGTGTHQQPANLRASTTNTSNEARTHDKIQDLLDELKSPDADSYSHIDRLKRDYGRIKDSRAEYRSTKHVDEAVTSCDKILLYWLFRSPGIPEGNLDDSTIVKREDSFSDWACRIASQLETRPENTLQLVSMVEFPDPETTKFMFVWWQHLIGNISGRLGTIYHVPVRVLQSTIAHYWDIELMPWSVSPDVLDSSSISRPTPFKPPSVRSMESPKDTEAKKVVWGHDSMRPGNLDPSRQDNEILLTWGHRVTKFDSDLVTYIWQYQKSEPDLEHAKIALCPGSAPYSQPRLLISFGSTRTHDSFVGIYKKSSDESTSSDHHTTEVTKGAWVPMRNAIFSICIVFDVMITDTTEFLETCHKQTIRMKMLGRQRPSISKMRFLMHLEDCRQVGHYGVRHGLEVLDSLGKWAQKIQIASTCQKRLEMLTEDLQYLKEELEKLGTIIQNDKDMLQQHFQLSSGLTGFRLTLLAGFFLPLSFVTSLFGMNIKSLTQEGPTGFSDFTNDTLSRLPDHWRNSTQALVSSVGSNGTLTHEWSTFAIASLCILATFPLTLTIGAIARSLVVFTTKYATYWWLPLVLPLVLIFASVGMFGRLISQFAADIFLYLFYIANGILTLYLLGTTYRAWETRHRVFIHGVFTAITFLLFLLEALSISSPLSPFPLMAIPWLFLPVWYLIIPWYMRRRESKLKRKALDGSGL